jgi:cytochrome P450
MTTVGVTSDQLDAAARLVLEPDSYADIQSVDDATRFLRDHSPIHFTEHPDYYPMWVVTRHAHVREVLTNSTVWASGVWGPLRQMFLQTRDDLAEIEHGRGASMRMLIDYDGQEHRAYRDVTQSWFRPRALAVLNDRIAELAKRAIDKMEAAGDRCDFMKDVAVHFPLETICSILGLPEEDYPIMLKMSQRMIGVDPSVERVDRTSQEFEELIAEMVEYFSAITVDRKKHPTGDLATVIANAKIPGVGDIPFMPDMFGYFIIISVAGHETTSASMGAGIRAFCENPEQYQRLRANPSREAIVNAADEAIRLASGVKHVCRVATEPYRLGDVDFQAGDKVFLSLQSANRDERIFEDPTAFQIARPNAAEHLGFGFGTHFCLGAQLARMQVRALFEEFTTRVRDVEVLDTPELSKSNVVSGLKTLSIRYNFI